MVDQLGTGDDIEVDAVLDQANKISSSGHSRSFSSLLRLTRPVSGVLIWLYHKLRSSKLFDPSSRAEARLRRLADCLSVANVATAPVVTPWREVRHAIPR